MSVLDRHKEEEEKARQEAIQMLKEQIKVEGELIGLYERTAPSMENKPVKHILHMIELDSR